MRYIIFLNFLFESEPVLLLMWDFFVNLLIFGRNMLDVYSLMEVLPGGFQAQK